VVIVLVKSFNLHFQYLEAFKVVLSQKPTTIKESNLETLLVTARVVITTTG
jgi:hypothetical protein